MVPMTRDECVREPEGRERPCVAKRHGRCTASTRAAGAGTRRSGTRRASTRADGTGMAAPGGAGGGLGLAGVAAGGLGGGPPGPGFGGAKFMRGPRVKRGDVRAAALALLAEEPRNGYQIIQEIGERSGGVWRPSPGSVYPALQQLEDEALIEAETPEGGR